MKLTDKQSAAPERLILLDQLRGYAIAGMVFVNWLGNFESMPWMLKHHREGMSYADTIAPLFMFVVGIGFQMTFLRRQEKDGVWAARWAGFKRYAGLTLLAIAFYGPDFRMDWWDALTDIGLAGILAIPFLGRSAAVRIAAAFGYLLIFQSAFSFTGYGEWAMHNTINGGPLGPISYAFVLLIGTLAWDWIAQGDRRRLVLNSLLWALGLCVAGWSLRLAFGETHREWQFSQFYMTVPYPLYSTGLSFVVLIAFHFINERLGWTIPSLTAIGRNALLMYIVQAIVIRRFENVIADNAPAWQPLVGFCVLYGFCWLVAWKLDKDKTYVRL